MRAFEGCQLAILAKKIYLYWIVAMLSVDGRCLGTYRIIEVE